ncbi:LysR family transcriptional regulator [Symbioplanes lichenis]|uniref:LysR family transcriptional regulator n=1 Tax=Symbioplanes lichenis TaxID=1629072 RepID=UPI00273983CC|nr:LysR family transcriptional regulator [Actinoplanes lichenis]
MLDLHRLRVFRAVVAGGSVHAAAAALGYTPSAISQHVTALQRETGLVLLARSGRGVEPTAVGLALAQQVDGVLASLGDVEALVADLRAGRTGSLSIAYFPSVGAAWMPAVARGLLAAFPDLRLDLELRDEPGAGPGRLPDLQVVVAPPDFRGTRSARAHHLHDDPYVAVVPRSHELAGRTEVELASLAAERWIDNDFARGWCRRNLLDACESAGFHPSFRVEAHDYPTAIAFVDAGIGITVLPRLGAAGLPDGVAVVRLIAPTPVRAVHAVVQNAVARNPPVAKALELLQACATGRNA